MNLQKILIGGGGILKITDMFNNMYYVRIDDNGGMITVEAP